MKTRFLAILTVLMMPFMVSAQNFLPFANADQQTANTASSFKQSYSGGVLLSSQQMNAGLTGYFFTRSISILDGDTLYGSGQFHSGPAISMQSLTLDPDEGDTLVTHVVACVIDTSGGGFDTLAITYSNNNMLGWTALQTQVPVVLDGMQVDTIYTGGAFQSDSTSVGFGAILTLEPQASYPGFSSGSVSLVGNNGNPPPVSFSVSNPGQTGFVRFKATSIQGITYSLSNWMPFVTLIPGDPDVSLDTVSIDSDELGLWIDLVTGDVSGNYIWQIFEPGNQTPVSAGNGNISSTSVGISVLGTNLNPSTLYTVVLIVQNSSPNSPFTFTWQVETAGLNDITYEILNVESTSSEVCAEIEITCPGQPGSLDLYVPEFGIGSTQSLLVSPGTDTYTVCVQYPSDSADITLEFIIEGLWDGQMVYATEEYATFDSELLLNETVGVSQLTTYDFSFDVSYDGDADVDVEVLIINQGNVNQVLYNSTFTYSPAPGSWTQPVSITGIPMGENWIVNLTATTADGLHTVNRFWGFSTIQEVVEEITVGNVVYVNEVDREITVDFTAYLYNGGVSVVDLMIGEFPGQITSLYDSQALNGADSLVQMGVFTIDYGPYADNGWDKLYFRPQITSPQGQTYVAGNYNFFDIPEENEPEPLYGPVIIGSTQGSIGETYANIRYEVNPMDSLVGLGGYLEVYPEGEPMFRTDTLLYPTHMENLWQLLDLTPGTDHEYRIVLTYNGVAFMWGQTFFMFTTDEEVIIDPSGIEEVIAQNYNARGVLINSLGQVIDDNALLRDYQNGHRKGDWIAFWLGDDAKLKIVPVME